MRRKKTLERLAAVAILAAVAAVFGYIDAILPIFDFLAIPGIKLGLANLAVLVALCLYGAKEAAAVDLVRILLVNLLLFPSFTALVYSLAGGALSFVGMLLVKKCSFHPINVSIVGGVLHNLAQVAVAVLLLRTPGLWSYLLLLFPAGVVTGALLGLIASLILPRLNRFAVR